MGKKKEKLPSNEQPADIDNSSPQPQQQSYSESKKKKKGGSKKRELITKPAKKKQTPKKQEPASPQKKTVKKAAPKPKVKKQEDDIVLQTKDDKKKDFLPGQTKPTPDDQDGALAFYKSLYEKNPRSDMARKFCLQYGVLELKEAEKLLKQMGKSKK